MAYLVILDIVTAMLVVLVVSAKDVAVWFHFVLKQWPLANLVNLEAGHLWYVLCYGWKCVFLSMICCAYLLKKHNDCDVNQDDCDKVAPFFDQKCQMEGLKAREIHGP